MLEKTKRFITRKEDGIGTIEVVLILVVLIALVILFREQIMGLLDGIFGNINESVNGLY
ncbi:MAG: hypothetical protein IKN57_08315 [Parasporobacterium sp.]|nr:hypothetical protein [Parasporobacterium sp.]